MKTVIALALLVVSFSAAAQWSNTTNQFFDTLHTPVCTTLQSQDEPIVVRSYPDGGYFVIWQDSRNIAITKADIYAQKYDADGNRLWAENGNPVTTGPNAQYYKYGGLQDYRNRSFAATDSTGGGQVIGQELSTGFTGSSIFYDTPLITFGPSGTPVFSIADYYGSVRISPIDDGTRLRWGAMGRAIGTAIYKNNFYKADQPVIMLDTAGNDGIIAWRDNRNIPPASTGNNIYMRHINLNASSPRMPVRLVPTPYGPTESSPYVLYGTSQAFTPIEFSSINFEPSTTTLAEIFDNQYLGRVRTFIHQHTGTAVRTFNGQPYLNRNLTITTDTLRPGADIRMRLYFTTEEFNALKAADNSIVTPGDLIIINQPYVSNTVPTTYTPVGNETRISPEVWELLPGGFYVQFNTARFGNFFLMKSATAHVCPGGNAAITATLTGTTYQWQMDTGTGFVDITTDPHFSGINTATLQLINVPSDWYRYKFRCLVNDNPADVVALRFLANWTGAAGTDWNNAANWGCGAVPDANTDVVVNSGTVNVTADGACRTLTVKPGATVTVKPGVNLSVIK